MVANRVNVLWGILGLVGGTALGAWYMGSRIQSPAEMAARTAPPEPSPILVPVESRVLSSDVVTRGTVRFGVPPTPVCRRRSCSASPCCRRTAAKGSPRPRRSPGRRRKPASTVSSCRARTSTTFATRAATRSVSWCPASDPSERTGTIRCGCSHHAVRSNAALTISWSVARSRARRRGPRATRPRSRGSTVGARETPRPSRWPRRRRTR